MKKFLVAVSAFTLLGISSASAHTVLISSNPGKGSTVKVLPSKITLKFADPLLTLGKRAINKVVVTAPDNSVVTVGNDQVKGATLTDSLLNTQAIKGKYKVSYRVSAEDGHIVTGSFTFTLQN